jgi:hypothetical protein
MGLIIDLACFQIGPSEKILGPKNGAEATDLSGSCQRISTFEAQNLGENTEIIKLPWEFAYDS